ncbi:DNA mismatch repair protein MutH [Roseibacterium beibuensis]|uniref:DNA mismatch repair protein MutH n=1 Tax=[Roseibacterium] beibuensis TaxID=1193142 RepID=UPI00217CD049|nr:DNA mismatch repair protein MutH [Roseibacterium beibuensis]MCS6625507.1 DNA mismatch repair protein MutH [Roseibacterium beibuensis]
MPRNPKTRAPYLMVSPPTWALARADYLGGMTAEQVADKHGIGLHNLRQTMARKGWTKRALADARATAGPGGPPVTAASLPAADPGLATGGGDLLEAVLARARAALTGGRGGEASALLKATREYVIMRQEIEDARAANADGVAVWDRARPDQAGALTETVTIQTLYARWSKLSEVELAVRADPTGKAGLAQWVKAFTEGKRRG